MQRIIAANRVGIHKRFSRGDIGVGGGPVAPGASSYLLFDRFDTSLSAGAVNGTFPEPGPGGKRVVTDGNSKLSISGGVLSCATGGVGVGNPSLWYSQITRMAGLVIMCRATPGLTTASSIGFGWDNGQAGAVQDAFRFSATADLQVLANGAAALSVASFAVADYDLAMILRAAGTHMLIRGGIYTKYTLLWSHTGGTYNPFPAIGALAATSVFTADNIRIPTITVAIVPVASDSFNRANGVLGSTDGLGHQEQDGGGGKPWTDSLGTWAISTNKAASSALSGGLAIATIDSGVTDMLIDSELARSAGNIGIVLRYIDNNNYIRAYHDGTNARLDKVVGGTPTNVRTGVAAFSAGAQIRVSCEGTGFRLFYNNVAISTPATISDGILQSGTRVGLYTTDTGNTNDNLVVRARGTGSEYESILGAL